MCDEFWYSLIEQSIFWCCRSLTTSEDVFQTFSFCGSSRGNRGGHATRQIAKETKRQSHNMGGRGEIGM